MDRSGFQLCRTAFHHKLLANQFSTFQQAAAATSNNVRIQGRGQGEQTRVNAPPTVKYVSTETCTKLSFHEKPQIFLWGGAIPPDPYPIWRGIPPHLIPRGLRLSPGHLATPKDVGYTIYYLRQLSKYDMKTNAPSTLYLS